MNYVLSLKKWRCGGHGSNRMGNGRTMMLNPEGYQCCLGQFASQMGVSDDAMLWTSAPGLLKVGDYDPAMVKDDRTTKLAFRCMIINDDPDLSNAERIDLVRAALEEHGHTLEVVE